jgi:hypothetical protein
MATSLWYRIVPSHWPIDLARCRVSSPTGDIRPVEQAKRKAPMFSCKTGELITQVSLFTPHCAVPSHHGRQGWSVTSPAWCLGGEILHLHAAV